MRDISRWSYIVPCTICRSLEIDEYGDSLWFSVPETIMCDYQSGLSAKIGDIGTEQVVKNTFWTEFSDATKGDYILIGESAESDPVAAGADEVMQVIRYADTFDRLADDYAILTGV